MNPWLHEVSALASALAAADSTGLLAFVGQERPEPDGIAVRLGLDPRATALVIAILKEHGVLVERAGRIEPSDALASALEDELADPGRASRLWASTEALLRTGRSPAWTEGHAALGEAYARAVPQLGRRFVEAARNLADALSRELATRAPRVLDVGAGSGVWSLGLIERLGAGHAVALDLPKVARVFLDAAASRRLSASAIEGDYFEAPLAPAEYDVAILGNVLHLEPPERARKLVERASSAVNERGAVVVIDVLSDGSPAAERLRAAYALHLALRIPEGRVHPRQELEQWLHEVGRPRIRRVALDRSMPGLAALTASR